MEAHTLGWLLFLLAALLPGSRSKENLEFRTLKSTPVIKTGTRLVRTKGQKQMSGQNVDQKTEVEPCLGEKRGDLQRCDVWSGSGLGATS